MKKTHVVMGLLVGFGLMLTACNSSSGTAAVASGDLVGKWYLRKEVTQGTMHMKMTAAGFSIDTTTHIDTTATYTGTTYYVEFKSDNSFNGNLPDPVTPPSMGMQKRSASAGTDSGSWSVSGNTLTTVSAGKDTTKIVIAISGNTLTGSQSIDSTMTQQGMTMELHMTAGLTFSK